MPSQFPQVGDVIMSPSFAFGYRDVCGHRAIITVDGKTTTNPVSVRLSESEWLQIAAQTGKVPAAEKTVNCGAHDSSRGTAKFVVENANLQGGDTKEGYPDGWHVQARRLNPDDSYDPNGEVIQFYMSGCFIGVIPPKHVQIVGKKTRKLMFV